MRAKLRQGAANPFVARGTTGRMFARTKLNVAIAAVHGEPAAPAATAPASPSDTTLQEITVTSRKRIENLQDVPQSICVHQQGSAEPRDLTIRGLRHQDPLGDLHQHRAGHADVLHAWSLRRQQSERLEHFLDRFFIDDMSMSYYDHRETTNEPRVFGLHLTYRFGKGWNRMSASPADQAMPKAEMS